MFHLQRVEKEENMKKLEVMSVAWAVLFGLSFCVHAQVIPGAEGSPFGSYLNDQTPLISKVSQTPEAPAAKQDVTVSAEIANDPQKTDDVTEKAFLFYSTDKGKTWLKVDMVQDAGNEALWSGKIPGQAAGATVMYYVQGVDTSGNLASELPKNTASWPPDPAKKSSPTFANPGSDEDDADAAVSPDIDILNIAVGYDDQSVYVKLGIQGKVTQGTESPVYIQGYASGILNPDKGEDILQAGMALLYAPLGEKLFGPTFGIKGSEFIINAAAVESKQVPQETDSGEASFVDGSTLYMRVKKSFLGDNPSGAVKILSLTAAITCTDLSSITSCLVPGDASKYVYAYFRDHSYTVK